MACVGSGSKMCVRTTGVLWRIKSIGEDPIGHAQRTRRIARIEVANGLGGLHRSAATAPVCDARRCVRTLYADRGAVAQARVQTSVLQRDLVGGVIEHSL